MSASSPGLCILLSSSATYSYVLLITGILLPPHSSKSASYNFPFLVCFFVLPVSPYSSFWEMDLLSQLDQIMSHWLWDMAALGAGASPLTHGWEAVCFLGSLQGLLFQMKGNLNGVDIRTDISNTDPFSQSTSLLEIWSYC